MIDKRMGGRLKKRVALRYGEGERLRLAYTEDLSKSGLFIKTAMLHPVGSVLRVEFQLPDGQGVCLRGRVRWARRVPSSMLNKVKKGGMGIEILEFIAGGDAFGDYLEAIKQPGRAVISA